MQAVAELRGWSPFIAMQMEYSLIERTGERELIPMANEMEIGVLPWSPLANGLLTGTYSEKDFKPSGAGSTLQGTRKDNIAKYTKPDERKMAIVEEVKKVAAEIDRSPAQVALAWLRAKAAVTSILLGARTSQQLKDNMGVLETVLSRDQIKRLDACSSVALGFPHDVLTSSREMITGGVEVERRSRDPIGGKNA
jgi:aryl-alcohol dehydrogenase-like predicted oxidoreductase